MAKTKEMIRDFRKDKMAVTPLSITGQQVEIVDSFQFSGTTIANTLQRDLNAESIPKMAQQRMLFFLCQLKKFRVNKSILTQSYRAIIESVLTFSVTVWYGSASLHNKNMLEGIVKAASNIILRKATTIISVSSHPANHLFELLPSGKRFRSTSSFPLGSGSGLSTPSLWEAVQSYQSQNHPLW